MKTIAMAIVRLNKTLVKFIIKTTVKTTGKLIA